MAVKDLTSDEITALVGTRHPKTGALIVPRGQQNFDALANNAWLHAFDASAGWLQVREDDAADTTVRIMAGVALLNGVVLTYAGGTLALAAYNNDVAYVWLQDNGSGVAQISAATDATGWPSGNHIKLAEVTLVSSAITAILDRRPQTFLSDGSLSPGTAKALYTIGLGLSTARMAFDLDGATGNYVLKFALENLTNNRTLTVPNETGIIATQEYVAGITPDLSAVEDLMTVFDLAITSQGDTATPTTVVIQAKDIYDDDINPLYIIRVRVTDAWGNAANATIATTDGTLLESLTTDKDLIIQSNAMDGSLTIEVTNATAESVIVRVGPPPVGGGIADYSRYIGVTHAAP